MSLPVGETAPDRRAHTGRDVGVDDVHVDRDVHERRARDPLQCLADDGLDAPPVELAHGVDADAALPHVGTLGLVERADTDEDDVRGVERRQRPGVAGEGLRVPAERRAQRHAVDVAARRRRGRVQVAVGVEPDRAAHAVHRRHASERAERDRMVAAQDDRRPLLADGTRDRSGDPLAGLLDLGEEAGLRVAARSRLGDGGRNVAPVGAAEPELLQPVVEVRVADGRRPHVDPAPARAQVECRPDDGDVPSIPVGHGP